jgi:hypothetical protein
LKSYSGDYGDDYDEDCVFPFHSICLDLLVRYLTDPIDLNKLDRDALYLALADRNLPLFPGRGYGILWGTGQYWDCVPGEEVLLLPIYLMLIFSTLNDVSLCLVRRG